jgi:hypothetical protein
MDGFFEAAMSVRGLEYCLEIGEISHDLTHDLDHETKV